MTSEDEGPHREVLDLLGRHGRARDPFVVCLASVVAHPIMFDEADPFLHRVRALALAFPAAAEKVSHGRPAFFTTKVFAYYGGSVKVAGTYQQHEQSVAVLLEPGEREALLREERCYLPAYLGPSGWLGVDLTDETDWDEIGELLEASYRRTAGPRRVALLDSQRPQA